MSKLKPVELKPVESNVDSGSPSDGKSSMKIQLRVPRGFFTLLEMFTRDLLQNKPSDVFQYGASYFESLLWNRTQTGHDPAIHGAITTDNFINIYARPKARKSHKSKASAMNLAHHRRHSTYI